MMSIYSFFVKKRPKNSKCKLDYLVKKRQDFSAFWSYTTILKKLNDCNRFDRTQECWIFKVFLVNFDWNWSNRFSSFNSKICKTFTITCSWNFKVFFQKQTSIIFWQRYIRKFLSFCRKNRVRSLVLTIWFPSM